MCQATVVDLDDHLALDAAALSVDTKLALADSIMLATARADSSCRARCGSRGPGYDDAHAIGGDPPCPMSR
jgi:hypothetical protein